MALIYVVEDDKNISEIESFALKNAGHQIVECACAKEFHKQVQERIPDMVLLDIMLPGEDGMELLRKLKASKKTREIPVIMVTAKGAEYDKVKGLDAGADDYVTKPFGMMELISRIKAVLRRSANGNISSEDTFEIGEIRLNPKKHEVTVHGEVVNLTLKEYELLKRLMKNSNIVLTRDQLLEDIWGYDFDGETRTVDVHVRTLRQKLGDAGEQIETVRGVGYRMSR